MRIFNRERDKTHALYVALDKMLRSKKTWERAVASNFAHDPRVSESREKSFVKFAGACISKKVFEEQHRSYCTSHISGSHVPEFGEKGNVDNVVHKPPASLVTVFVVNGLWRMFQWARQHGKDEVPLTATAARRAVAYFEGFPAVVSGEDRIGVDWVDKIMSDPAARRRLIGMICELHAVYRKDHPYHPIWLTTRAAFRACAGSGSAVMAARWVHRVGVSAAAKNRQWVMLVVFRTANIDRLYRPTVLDGASVYHVPTPAGSPVGRGGMAADLRMEGLRPAVEYIANWPSLKDAVIDLNRGCNRVKAIREASIKKVRKHHLSHLKRLFRTAEAQEWLDRVTAAEL